MAKNDKSAEIKTAAAANEVKKPAEKPAKHKSSGGFWLLVLLLAIVGAGAYVAQMWPQLTGSTQNTELQQWQTATNAKIRALEEQVNNLNYELIKVKNAAPQVVNNGMSEAEVMALLDAAKQDILAAATSTTAPAAEEKTEKAAPIIEEKVITVEKDKPLTELLLASGAIIVRDMAEQGLPFAYEAEVLQILAQGNPLAEKYVAAAQQYAVSGLKGKQELIAAYDHLYDSLNDAPLKTAPAAEAEVTPQTWQEKIWRALKKLVVYKKKVKKPEFKAEQDPVYALVNEGKLAEALAKIQTSNAYTMSGSEALQAWTGQVQTYLDFNRAMTGLIMNALANIRLKELQH